MKTGQPFRKKALGGETGQREPEEKLGSPYKGSWNISSMRELEGTPEKSAGTGGRAPKAEKDKNRAERPRPLEPHEPLPSAPRHPSCLGKTSH